MYCNILWMRVFITMHGLGIVAFSYQALKFKNVHVSAKIFLNIYSVKKHSYCDQNFISLIDYFTNEAQLYIEQIIYISIDCKMCW